MEAYAKKLHRRRRYLKNLCYLNAGETQVGDVHEDPVVECSSFIGEQCGDNQNLDWEVSSLSDYEDDHLNLSELSTDSTYSEDEDESKNPDQPLQPGSSLTLRDSLALVSTISSRHKLSKVATADLLKILRLHLAKPSIYPKTIYKYQKLLQQPMEWTSYQFFCEGCELLMDQSLLCGICKLQYNAKDLKKNGSFFLLLDLRKQIEILLSDAKCNFLLTQYFSEVSYSGQVSDIVSGKMYKNLRKHLYDLTCTFNTDGVPVFKSSNSSAWPFLISINELPYRIRKYRTLVAALWYGNSKPNMTLYLKSVVKMLTDLNQYPIIWRLLDGREVKSYLHSILCAVDAPARCLMQGHTQFNGQFGCTWCEHPGMVVKRGKGHSRIYEICEDTQQRSDRKYKGQISRKDFSKGIKKVSPLTGLRGFDIVSGFSTDYMHCVFLGVVRTLSSHWASQVGADYYLGTRICEIDQKLAEVRVPFEFTRTSRGFSTRKHWKASEWRTWLFIAPVVLKGILKNPYLRHFKRLSQAIHILSCTDISDDSIRKAEIDLKKFMQGVEKLYGIEYCTYNVHQLGHLCDCVRNWGSLWATSAFQFETFNGKLLSYIKSPKGVELQISSSFVSELRVQRSASFEKCPIAAELFSTIVKTERMTSGIKRPRLVKPKSVPVYSQIKLFGKISNLYQAQAGFLSNHLYNTVERNSKKRINSVVRISDNTLGYLQMFYQMTCKCTKPCNCVHDLVLVRRFNVTIMKNLCYCYCFDKKPNYTLEVFPICHISAEKFVTFDVKNETYFISVPNLFEAE